MLLAVLHHKFSTLCRRGSFFGDKGLQTQHTEALLWRRGEPSPLTFRVLNPRSTPKKKHGRAVAHRELTAFATL